MDPYHINTTTAASRAEAERWLAIAEKLLAGRDLVGSKTFAIRARESEPRLDAADQILAVADTLIAGDKLINSSSEWYSVLQLPPLTADLELIAAHYRRLAVLLNSSRLRLSYADQALQLVSDAWSVLSNPNRKSIYDNELNFYLQQQQQQQQQFNTYEFNQMPPQQPTPPAAPKPNNNNNTNNTNYINKESETSNNSTFWTTCPYCYNMYEYPKAYEDCSLRCQNCRRAFHGARVAPPPDNNDGTYFTWGFYPLGVEMSFMEKNKGGVGKWTPFSPMFSCPRVGGGVKKKPRRPSGPRVYIDDDEDEDIFRGATDSSEESDDEWGSTRRKKKSKRGRPRKKSQGENVKSNKVSANDGSEVGPAMHEAPPGETNRKTAAVSGKKQAGKVPKDWGKLDLNVEFSNEVEEPASGLKEGTRPAHGEEDGIEGIGFFEGLDEFLSSLPILNVVGDDKVKAA